MAGKNSNKGAAPAYCKFQNVASFPNLEDFITTNQQQKDRRVILDIRTPAPNADLEHVHDADPKEENSKAAGTAFLSGFCGISSAHWIRHDI